MQTSPVRKILADGDKNRMAIPQPSRHDPTEPIKSHVNQSIHPRREGWTPSSVKDERLTQEWTVGSLSEERRAPLPSLLSSSLPHSTATSPLGSPSPVKSCPEVLNDMQRPLAPPSAPRKRPSAEAFPELGGSTAREGNETQTLPGISSLISSNERDNRLGLDFIMNSQDPLVPHQETPDIYPGIATATRASTSATVSMIPTSVSGAPQVPRSIGMSPLHAPMPAPVGYGAVNMPVRSRVGEIGVHGLGSSRPPPPRTESYPQPSISHIQHTQHPHPQHPQHYTNTHVPSYVAPPTSARMSYGLPSQTHEYQLGTESVISRPKRAKTTLDVPPRIDVHRPDTVLEGEPDNVKVFDTCDDVRAKIRELLDENGISQAAFLRELGKVYTPPRRLQSKSLNDFLIKSGPRAGNTSCIYYSAYVFFEKMRIRDGQPKTDKRVKMEGLWPEGMNITEVRNRIYVRPNETVWEDEYGCIRYSSPPPEQRRL